MASNEVQSVDSVEWEIDNVDVMSEEEVNIPQRVGQGEAADAESHEGFQRKKRKKTSVVWEHMSEVVINGVTMVQCKHCMKTMTKNQDGTTTQYTRHLNRFHKSKDAGGASSGGTQQILQFGDGGKKKEASITNFKYDHAKLRETVARAILMHEYPFNIVEHVGFNDIMKVACPWFVKISRNSAREDCFRVYNIEKSKLFDELKKIGRIGITTDLWKSCQKTQYMVVTAHFIDSDWQLQKRVLNLCNVPPPHTGELIAEALAKCISDWSLNDKISSITVDNASYNDKCIRNLKEHFMQRKALPIGGRLFHVRCCAHIINLLVQDGLKEIGDIIDTVRDAVKYLNASESRLRGFGTIAKQYNGYNKKLILDCPTRWNSTYMMLSAALPVKHAFTRYGDVDKGFEKFAPSMVDWDKVGGVCEFLKLFYSITNTISAVKYPISNMFLVELARIKMLLDEKMNDLNEDMKAMSKVMLEKFDKYWGECNVLLSLAALLDPRLKKEIVTHCFKIIFGPSAYQNNVDDMVALLKVLFEEYRVTHTSASGGSTHSSSQASLTVASSSKGKSSMCWEGLGDIGYISDDETPSTISEVDIYLNEKKLKASPDLDVLLWWKLNSGRFSILSRVARDLLSVPVSTVASESTFSAGGRAIDDYRSSLSVGIVEMLLCAGDWVRQSRNATKAETDDQNAWEEIILPD